MDFKNKTLIIPNAKYFENDKKENANQLDIDSYYKFHKTLELNNLDDEIYMIIPEVVLYELISNKMKSSDADFQELKEKYLDDEKNIIKIQTNKEILFKTILKRSLEKTPPFTKTSDNGFKDTILFLSLLEFCKNNDFKRCILISSSNMVNKKEKLQKEFGESCESELEIMYKKDFNKWFDNEYGLFTGLEEYLENGFYSRILEKYSWAHNIFWGNGDTVVEDYSIRKQETEMYQIDSNKYEVSIYLSIEINRSLDATVGEFYEKNDEYYINQRETYIIKQKSKWKHKLISSTYDVFFNEPDYEDFNEFKRAFKKK